MSLTNNLLWAIFKYVNNRYH